MSHRSSTDETSNLKRLACSFHQHYFFLSITRCHPISDPELLSNVSCGFGEYHIVKEESRPSIDEEKSTFLIRECCDQAIYMSAKRLIAVHDNESSDDEKEQRWLRYRDAGFEVLD